MISGLLLCHTQLHTPTDTAKTEVRLNYTYVKFQTRLETQFETEVNSNSGFKLNFTVQIKVQFETNV